VHWRFSTKLSSSICIQGSLSSMLQSLEVSLHTLLFNFSGEQSFLSSDVELQPMDIADDIKTHVEACLVYWNK
jgi:hypothetical protein